MKSEWAEENQRLKDAITSAESRPDGTEASVTALLSKAVVERLGQKEALRLAVGEPDVFAGLRGWRMIGARFLEEDLSVPLPVGTLRALGTWAKNPTQAQIDSIPPEHRWPSSEKVDE